MKKALNLKMKAITALTLLAILTGFFFMVSYRANTSTAPSAQELRNQELRDYIQKLEGDIADLEQQILSARQTIATVQGEQSDDEALLSSLNMQLNKLKDQAGITEAQGPGLVITIDDNKVGAELAQKNNPNAYFPENYLVHSTDVLYMLKAIAGEAEAISINNQRVVDSTNIRCVGTVVMLNSALLAPPYNIMVIGDPDKLEEAVLNSYEYAILKNKEMPVTITRSEELTIPAYTGAYTTTYSQIPREGGEDDINPTDQ